MQFSNCRAAANCSSNHPEAVLHTQQHPTAALQDSRRAAAAGHDTTQVQHLIESLNLATQNLNEASARLEQAKNDTQTKLNDNVRHARILKLATEEAAHCIATLQKLPHIRIFDEGASHLQGLVMFETTDADCMHM
jgi:septal ring factor EnvC (AmiA/AmiB activator)